MIQIALIATNLISTALKRHVKINPGIKTKKESVGKHDMRQKSVLKMTVAQLIDGVQSVCEFQATKDIVYCKDCPMFNSICDVPLILKTARIVSDFKQAHKQSIYKKIINWIKKDRW